MISQDNRLLTLTGPVGATSIVPQSLTGFEAISDEFEFIVHGISNQTDLSATDWLGKKLTTKIKTATTTKTINGIVKQFVAGDYQADHTRHYQLKIVPWFASLDLQQDCRIFQDMSIPKIFQTLCHELGFTDFDISKLAKQYQPVKYITQFNETTRYFLRRILAEAGIYYVYIQSDNKHTLTLLDEKSHIKAKTISYPLANDEQTKAHFFSWKKNNNAKPKLKAIAESNIVDLNLNQIFQLQTKQFNEFANDYRILKIQHQAHDLSQQSKTHDQKLAQRYQNQITVQTAEQLVTPASFKKPIMRGPLSAKITGPANKSIYTDQFGRVKVQFIWDRHNKHDQNSSCWLRVIQPTMGEGIGTQFIPRVGDEILVDFLHGDADNPVIIGSVYNSQNKPIFDATKLITGFKTRLITSTQDNAESQIGHEFSNNDSTDNNNVKLHSAGDYKQNIKNSLAQYTGKDETLTIAEDQLIEILQGSSEYHADVICLKAGNSELVLNQHGVGFNPAGKLLLKAKAVGGSYPLAHIGDKSACPRIVGLSPDVGGPVTKGSHSTIADGKPAARVGDPLSCVNGKDHIKKGAKNILIDNKPTAHVSSKTKHGGVVKKGSHKVLLMDRQAVNITPYKPAAPQQPLQANDIADIIYITEDNSFYALTEQDSKDLTAAAKPLMDSLIALNNILNTESEDAKQRQQAILSAKQQVNQQLKSCVKSPKDIKITEVTHFIGKKHTYIASDKMKNHWRSYKIDNDIQTNKRADKIKAFYQKMQDPTNGKIDIKKVRTAAAKAMGKPSSTVHIASGEWSASYKTFEKHVGNQYFDASAQAQLLRAAAGGAAKANFDPKKSKVSLSATGHAEAALAQGQLKVNSYVPSIDGWHLNVILPDKNALPTNVDLGAFRVHLDLTAYGFVGASVAAGANLNLTLTKQGNETYKLQAQGSNKVASKTQYKYPAAKAKAEQNGLKTEANAFAGAKAGGDIGAQASWQDPEANMAWCELAQISANGAVALGVGAGLGFSVGYLKGKFYIRAHAEAVCGPGVSGDIGWEIEAKNILKFVKYVYYKVKAQHFSFVGFFIEEAFPHIIDMFTKFLHSEIDSLEQIAEDELGKIRQWWRNMLSMISSSDDKLLEAAENFASGINANPAKLKYTLPEVKGRMLALFTQKNLRDKIHLQASQIMQPMSPFELFSSEQAEAQVTAAQLQQIQAAIVHILGYIQTKADFANVIQHMALDNSKVTMHSADYQQREQQLYDGLGEYGRYLSHQDPHINQLISQLKHDVIYQADTDTAQLQQPVTQNQEVSVYV